MKTIEVITLISNKAKLLLESYTKAIANLNHSLTCQNEIDKAFDDMSKTRLDLESYIESLESTFS